MVNYKNKVVLSKTQLANIKQLRHIKGFTSGISFADHIGVERSMWTYIEEMKIPISLRIFGLLKSKFPRENFSYLSQDFDKVNLINKEKDELELENRNAIIIFLEEVKRQKGFTRDTQMANLLQINQGTYSHFLSGELKCRGIVKHLNKIFVNIDFADLVNEVKRFKSNNIIHSQQAELTLQHKVSNLMAS